MWRGRFVKQLAATKAWERDDLETVVVPFFVMRIRGEQVLVRSDSLGSGQWLYEFYDLATWQPSYGSFTCELQFMVVDFNNDYVAGLTYDQVLHYWSRHDTTHRHELSNCPSLFKLYDHTLVYSSTWPCVYESMRACDLRTNTPVVYPLTRYVGCRATFGTTPHIAFVRFDEFMTEVDLWKEEALRTFPTSQWLLEDLWAAVFVDTGVDWKTMDEDLNEMFQLDTGPGGPVYFDIRLDSVSGNHASVRVGGGFELLRVWDLPTWKRVYLPQSVQPKDPRERTHIDFSGLTIARATSLNRRSTWMRGPASVLRELWPDAERPVPRWKLWVSDLLLSLLEFF